jgi:HAD superfamily hydrolase (TIGR01509 family)
MSDQLRHPILPQIKGVLFDVDGTLVDSTFLHAVCWWQALRQADFDASMAVIHRAVGMGADNLVKQVLGEDVDADVAALSASHDALYSAYWPSLRALPGARELLQTCHQAGLTTVLASSAKARELSVLTEVLGVDDAVDVTTSSSDADSSKPAPDIVEVALKKAKLTPGAALFVGDAVWDVQASSKSGVACIGLESGGTSAAELLEAGAIATFKDPADLLRHSEEWLR